MKTQINNNIQLSGIILVYELVMLVLYYTIKINKQYLSWPILLNFFIIFVVLFCDCNLPATTIYIVIAVKIVFLLAIIHIVNFSIKNFFYSLLFLAGYYILSDINDVYDCNIKVECLIISIGVSSIIYLWITLMKYLYR